MISDRIAILGAGRGLGLELCKVLKAETRVTLLGLSKHANRVELNEPHQARDIDFTASGAISNVLNELQAFQPTRIWYVSGGGPHGPFLQKEWKDHMWAFRLNFLFPLELFHAWSLLNTSQWIFVGSGIAESLPEVNGLAYGASKCALKSAWSNFQAEAKAEAKHSGHNWDVRLYSPGYLDSGMLPPRAWPRLSNARINSLSDTAEDFIQWAFDISHKNDHRIFGV